MRVLSPLASNSCGGSHIVPKKSRNNSAGTVKMVKDLETKIAPYKTNNVYREIFEEFYDFSDASNYKLTLGAVGITFTGINRTQMNIANVQEGGLRLRNQTLDLTLFSKKSFTICVVMQLWLNRSMSIKTIMGNGAYDKPHLIYDRTTKKLKLQTNGDDGEDSITVLNSFNGKRVVFWLTKNGTGFRLVVKVSISNHSATLMQLSNLASQNNYKFQITSEDAVIHKVMYSPNFYDFDFMQYHKIKIKRLIYPIIV